MNKGREGAAKFAERRRVEDEAPRLRDVQPLLTSLKIECVDGRSDSSTTQDVSHTRRVMVAVAPALFIIPCGDPSCKDGGHDLTNDILRGLRDERTEIKGEHGCMGEAGKMQCGRVLRYTAIAEYAKKP